MPGFDKFYHPARGVYYCGRDFVSQNALAAHHTDSPFHWLCEDYYDDDICSFDGDSYEDLCNHWAETGCYKFCQECREPGSGWLDNEDLRQHRLLEYGRHCRECGDRRVFICDEGLRQHTESVHSQPRVNATARPSTPQHTHRTPKSPAIVPTSKPSPIRQLNGVENQLNGAPSFKPLLAVASTAVPHLINEPQVISAPLYKNPFAPDVSKDNVKPPAPTSSSARTVAPAEKFHSIVTKTNRLTSRRLDDFSDAANYIAANMNNTNSLLQKPSPNKSFATTALTRDGLLPKAKSASIENQSLRVNRLRPRNDSGGPAESATRKAPLSTRPNGMNHPAPANLDDSTATIAAHLARRAGSRPTDVPKVQSPAATAPNTNSAPPSSAPKDESSTRKVAPTPRLVSIDVQPTPDRIDAVQQNISRTIEQNKSPAATVTALKFETDRSSTSTAKATKESTGPIACSASCTKRFSTLSDFVGHIEEGDCSTIKTVDLYQASVGCPKSSHLLIWGRYHVDMDERRDLKDKYLTNAWPFMCPKAPCEDVFQSLKGLYEHVESGKCVAGQSLGAGAVAELTDRLRYRCSQGLI